MTQAQNKYRVVEVNNGTSNPHTGVISNHRTLEAAEAAIAKANAKLRRQAGYRDSRYPWAIQQAESISFTNGSTGIEWSYVRKEF
jgi:hypothetical protein